MMSEHFYFTGMLDSTRATLDDNGGASVPIFVTQFGWGTAENANAEVSNESRYIAENTAAEQAEFAVTAFTSGHARDDIGAMVLSNLNGCASGDVQDCYFSAIGADGSARPVYEAVKGLGLSSPDADAEATEEADENASGG